MEEYIILVDLNYSNMPEDKIIEGIKRMGEVLREELSNRRISYK